MKLQSGTARRRRRRRSPSGEGGVVGDRDPEKNNYSYFRTSLGRQLGPHLRTVKTGAKWPRGERWDFTVSLGCPDGGDSSCI